MSRLLQLARIIAGLIVCASCQRGDDARKVVQESERAAAARAAATPPCQRAVAMYSGFLYVTATDYGDGADLDRVISKAERAPFVLDYPFEKPFTGEVTAPITLRRTVDAIRAGFKKMYENTTERDIPGMANKDVSGAYGRAFHVIGDLVIERIDLCQDGRLEISIGS